MFRKKYGGTWWDWGMGVPNHQQGWDKVIIAVHKLALPAINTPCLDGYLHKFCWLNNMSW